jgi:hypothetical protein
LSGFIYFNRYYSTCRSRLSIPKMLFMSLKELGILKIRRVRAGLSAIPVICGTRRALKSNYCRSNSQSRCGVNKNNLIYASLDYSSPSVDRLPATLSLSLCLWNARSIWSKTGCFLDFIVFKLSKKLLNLKPKCLFPQHSDNYILANSIKVHFLLRK